MTRRRHLLFLLFLLLAAGGFTFSLFHPAPAGAFSSGILPDCATTSGDCGLKDFIELFTRAYGFGLSILGALSLFFFIYGGFLWLISGGSQERIAQGKRILSGTLLGVVIGLLSWLVVNVVIAFLVTPPGQPVDFTKVEIGNPPRPWWNFWGNIPTGCCVGSNGCSENVTQSKCEQELSGTWDPGDCNLDQCKQGCCVPSDRSTQQCADTSNGSCGAGFTYVPGAACTNVAQCLGCCVKFENQNICTAEQNSVACLIYDPYPCAANDPRCPGDPTGCCKDTNGGTTCTPNVRLHDCKTATQTHYAGQTCTPSIGCP